MHLVYFFEPWVELGRPFLRYHNLRYQLGPQIESLASAYHDLKVTVVMGEGTFAKCEMDGYSIPGVQFRIISTDQLKEIYPDYLSASLSLFNRTYSQAQGQAMLQAVSDALHGEQPDILISFLSSVPFIEESWPETLVLYAEFGLFSRAPYPRSFYFDAFGMFKHSYLRRFSKELSWLSPTAASARNLKNMRRAVLKNGICAHNPVPDSLPGYSNFKKTALLPLQFSEYFGFDGSCQYKSQYEFLTNVLDRLDPEIGLIVTEHNGWSPVITEHNETYLRSRYPNLIIPYNFRHFTNTSQFFLERAEAVISVSSSVALQALIWDKPVIAAGDSHLNGLSAGKIEDAADVIAHHPSGLFDGALCHLIEHYYPTERYVYDPAWALSFFKRSLNRHRAGERDFDFYDRIDTCDRQYKNLSLDMRINAFRQQIAREAGSPDEIPVALREDPTLRRKAELFSNYEYISFDVFDTLVQRPLMMPHQLFLLMQDEARHIAGDPNFQFHKLRRFAEHRCRIESTHDEVSLYEIYEYLGREASLTSEQTHAIMAAELDWEKKLCEPRPAGRELFDIARQIGRKIIIVSDFYCGSEFVESILVKCGYSGWEHILVSCDHRATKKSGILFAELLVSLKTCSDDVLHIGDNFVSDIENAKKYDINTLHLPKASELFFSNKSAGEIWKNELNRQVYPTSALHRTHSVVLGLFMNKIYGLPEGKDMNSAFAGNGVDLGYCVFGPMFLGFTLDILRRSQEQGIDDLLFLSRDGSLMRRCYDIVSAVVENAPSAHYMLTSRRALSVAVMTSEHDVVAALDVPFKPCSVRHLLEHKFAIDPEIVSAEALQAAEIESLDTIVHPTANLLQLTKLVKTLCPQILEQARLERIAAESYYRKFLDSSRRQALVDVGYTGSVQKQLFKLTGANAACFFLLTHLKAKELANAGVQINGFLGEFVDHTNSLNQFSSNISFIEAICSSPEKSLKSFSLDESGAPVPVFLSGPKLSVKRIETVRDVQNGIACFIQDFMARFGDIVDSFDFGPDFVGRWYFNMLRSPARGDAIVFDGVEHEDLYGGFDQRYIVSNVTESLRRANGRLTKEEAKTLIAQSDWKQGARALLPARAGTKKPVSDAHAPIAYATWEYKKKSAVASALENMSFQNSSARVESAGSAGRPEPFLSPRHMTQQVTPRKKRWKRLYLKFRRDPKQYFSDSKFHLFRIVGRAL